MSFKWSQSKSSGEAGYYYLFGAGKGLAIYALFALSLLCGLLAFDAQSAAGLLLFPLTLGLAVLAGLLFRLAGTMVVFGLVCLISGYAYILDTGLFQRLSGGEGLLFFSGFSFLVGVFSLAGAISIGYFQRSAELAEHRQNLLDKVFNALPIGIWVRARDGRSLFVNERWASFSALSVEQILSSDTRQAPVDLGSEWEAAVDEVLTADRAAMRYQAIELQDKEGHKSSMTLLTLRLMIDPENDFGTLSLLVDETALRLYEKKIRQSEENLHMALNNARMGFWEGTVTPWELNCDDNWYHLLGAERSANQSAFELWYNRLHPDERSRVPELYQAYYKNGQGSIRVNYRIRKGDQGYIWVQDNVRVIEYTAEGKPLRVMGTMQEVTEQKQAELELKEAKERAEAGNLAKNQFIATISHEIRTPLNAIIGLSSFLADSELEAEPLDLAQTIHSSGKSLLFLVNDILDFSKIEAGRLDLEEQEFPLRFSFEDCVKLFKLRASEKNVKLTLDMAEDLPEFAGGDMERLRQIVQNLLANALKFTNSGEVTLSARPVRLKNIDALHRPDSLKSIGYLDSLNHDYLEVRVADTGIGIPKDREHMLFEAFSQIDASMTRKYGGTGLGLVICKRLVDAMGGRIWVESEEGAGATFSFVVRIQLIDEQAGQSLASNETDEDECFAAKYPCDILVIGPEDATRLLVDSCRKLGYVPHRTSDYDLSGVAYRRKHYDVMFVWMGDELQALKFARKISASTQLLKPAPVIGYASIEQKPSIKRGQLSGMEDVLQLEPSPEVIREALLSALRVRD